MTHKILFAMCIFATCALAQPAKRTFIPSSPSTPESMEAKRDSMREAGLTDLEIDEIVADAGSYREYRDSDIFAALPELQGSRRDSVCSNSIMEGETRIVFIADSTERQLTAKTSRCSQVPNGLMCGSVESSTYFFYEEPENFFSLEGMTFEEALVLITAYKESGIENLPEAFTRFNYEDIKSIAATPQGYTISLGEVFCGGCSAKIEVRLTNTESGARLILAGTPYGACI